MDEGKRILPEAIKAKISKSMKGNRNAEKWKKKDVIDILESMIDFLMSEYEVSVENKNESGINTKGIPFSKEVDRKIKRKTHLKTDILVRYRIWNKQWFKDMRNKFCKEKNDDGQPNRNFCLTVSPLLDAIDMICESNTYNDAANGTSNANIAAMNLCTHYGYTTNKTDSKVTHDVGLNVSFKLPEPDDDIKKQWQDARNNSIEKDA